MKIFLGVVAVFFMNLASAGEVSPYPETRYQAVIGTKGMVVSDDRLASEWGAKILRKGGNAIDAAIATAFTLAVTRPHYATLGGGGFLLFCPRPTVSGPSACQIIDYREQAPEKSDRDMYIRNGKADNTLSENGPLAIGVPGTPYGLTWALEKFGTKSRQEVLSYPIQLASQGYPFTGFTEGVAKKRWASMNSEAQKIFGCKVKSSSKADALLQPCPPGTLIKQPDLANVLKAIAKEGRKGFYGGKTAKKITSGIQAAGGILSIQDLEKYQAKPRTPLYGNYKSWEIISMPPPSSGGLILVQLLNYARKAETQGMFENRFGSAESIHSLTHAMSLAFADRAHYMGDPDFVSVPLTHLLAPSYLEQRWKTFLPSQATFPENAGEILLPESNHTTHFSVIDRYGNAVSVTTTINNNFGSGFVPPGTGIVMNDQMDDFSIQPGVPNQFGLIGKEANAIHAGKRPLSSMSPTIVRDEQGNNRIVLGAEGGPKIPTSVFQTLWNRLYYGMSLPDAVSAPRVHHQWKPDLLYLEKNGFPKETTSRLEKMGYRLKEVNELATLHALEVFPNGRAWGFADPRGEGVAVAE